MAGSSGSARRAIVKVADSRVRSSDCAFGYAQSGDNPALRANAQAAVPIVTAHLEQARQLVARAR